MEEYESESESIPVYLRTSVSQQKMNVNRSSSSSTKFRADKPEFIADDKAEQQRLGRRQMHEHQTMKDCYILDEVDFNNVDDDGCYDDDIHPLPKKQGEQLQNSAA